MKPDTRELDPRKWSYPGWRRFFLAAAAWNILGSVPSIIAPGLNLRLFYSVASNDHLLLFLNRSLWWAVLIFGIGYLVAAISPGRHTGIIFMGVLGKVVVAANWVWLFGQGQASILAVMAAAGDSAFTVYFVAYLVFGPRSWEVDWPGHDFA